MVAPLHPTISISDLADLVNQWCDERQVTPANGQAGERITERNIRYYRSRGLLDAPGGDDIGRKRGFTEKHFLQLKAIRLLQARGLPLDQIQARIQGRGLDELRALERVELRMLADDGRDGAGAGEFTGAELLPGEGERWGVSALGSEFFLVSRRGRTLNGAQRKMIAAVLTGALEEPSTVEKSADGIPG
jgi:DNA-binding transcriptional MerR regulator